MSIGVPVLGTPDQATVAGTTPSTPAFPATDANDLLLLLGASNSGSSSIFTNPAGWTLDMQHASTADTVAPVVFGAHKLATGSESGTQSVDHGTTIASMGIVGLAGVDTTTPVQSSTLLDQSTGASTWTLPSVTVANAGSTLLYVAVANNNTSTFTPPTGWTELWDGVPNTAGSRAWSIGYKQGVAVGASGTADLGVSNSVRGLAIVYVVNPSADTTTSFMWNGTAWTPVTRHIWNGTAWT